MAVVHGKNTKVYVGGFDLSTYLQKAGVKAEADTPEVTGFGANGKQYIPGLQDATLQAEGVFNDDLLVSADKVLSAALNAQSIWTILREGDVFGANGEGCLAI